MKVRLSLIARVCPPMSVRLNSETIEVREKRDGSKNRTRHKLNNNKLAY